jgi:prepilin-type N-terminal cleavage/methylation domain-containing protein
MGHHRGFTLVELMVVIGIIVLLASVLVISFSGVFSKSDNAQATATIKTLESNIANFEARWGVPPPSNLNDLGVLVGYPALTDPNKENVGIESLVLALRSGREGGPYLDDTLLQDDRRRANLDIDTVVEAVTAPRYLDLEEGSSRDLFEILDPWGNPYVYIDQTSLQTGGFEHNVTLADGSITIIKVTEAQNALRHPVTGAFPSGYALWSFGENGINEYGRGDDVTSWPKYEQD